jgi:clan AA aspartic protease
MGTVYAEITLKNGGDVTNAQRGIITDGDVRSIAVTAVVDTGATTLVINDETCQKLGLTIENTSAVTLAGGSEIDCKVTEPVRIHWKDRYVTCHAFVLPGGNILLGTIPLEFMDLIVDPVNNRLAGAHGDKTVLNLM